MHSRFGPALLVLCLWLLAGFAGIAGLLAGLVLGSLADRLPPPTIARWSAGAAGLLMLPQALAHGFGVLFPARFGPKRLKPSCLLLCPPPLKPGWI